MPVLKREIFLRPTRFTHRFGERDDPLMPVSEQTFSMGYAKLPPSGKGKSLGIKTHGLHTYIEPFSPVDKARGGKASLSGPRLDEADAQTDVVPASTVMRRSAGPLITRKKDIGK